MRIKVKVTEDCIDNGRRNDCELCPVALALVNSTCVEPAVGSTDADFTFNGTRYVARKLPKKVQQFIREFDSYYTVEPFEFTLVVRKS